MDMNFWIWVVWSVVFGALAVVILVAAFKRKGRVAFLMLPLVLWIFSRPLLIFIHYSISESIVHSESSVNSAGDRLVTAGLIFRLIIMMGTTTWFLPLILIFKQDKPEEPPTPS